MILRPYEAGDLERLEKGEPETRLLQVCPVPEGPLIGNAVTAQEGERVLAIGGVTKQPSGIPLGWLLGSDEIRARPILLHRTFKRGLGPFLKEAGLDVVEALVDQKFLPAHEWIKRIGFEFVRWEPSGFLRYRWR